ncbi:MAG: hypothetical protein AABZ53_02460 [Planctomycetota bacterium]
MGWFAKPAEVPPRRPATSAELEQIATDWDLARTRSGSTTALVVALLAGLTIGITLLTTQSNGPQRSARGLPDAMMWTGFAVSAAAVLLLAVRAIKQSRKQRSLTRTLRLADPAAAPVVPILPGDHFGAFVVVAADPHPLHVAQSGSLLGFRFRRIVVLIAGLVLVCAGVGLAIAVFSGSKIRAGVIKLVLAMVAVGGGMVLFACRRATYQWTIEDRSGSPCLVLHQAGLFRASAVVEIPAEEIVAFVASQGTLAVQTLREGPYELAHLVKGAARQFSSDPLTNWRGLCLSSAIAAQLDGLFEFRSVDLQKRSGQAQVPAAIDPDLTVTPSTAPR